MERPTSIAWHCLSTLEMALHVAKDICDAALSGLRRRKADLRMAAFRRAMRERQLETLGDCIQHFSTAGYNPMDLWNLARRADPSLSENAWQALMSASVDASTTAVERAAH